MIRLSRTLALVCLLLLATVVVAACRDDEAPLLSLSPAFGGQTFERPIELVALPAGGFLLADQGGVVTFIDDQGAGQLTVLDVHDRLALEHEELGLLSLALDPAFAENRFFYVYFTAPGPLRSVVARFTLDANGQADPASELTILEVAQPFPNHNGGALRFGPDGMLYFGLGDGGDAWDPLNHSQDTATELGSILRIDVRDASPGEPYRIPPDNPFAGRPGYAQDIWAWGLRNPWRMAFDPATGKLWVGDVGQHEEEEVDIIHGAGNYGWNLREGTRCIKDGCSKVETVAPVVTYVHGDDRCAVTGGVVYHGGQLPQLAGRFLFGDLCSGEIWSVGEHSGQQKVADLDGMLVSFATDNRGDVFVLQFGGPIMRLGPPAN